MKVKLGNLSVGEGKHKCVQGGSLLHRFLIVWFYLFLFLCTFSHKIVDALPNMRKGFRTELSK